MVKENGEINITIPVKAIAEAFQKYLENEDVIHVVRCKDCRWWDAKEDGYEGYCHAAKHGYYSRNWEIGIYRLYGPDFFCADGERKGEEDDCD